MSLLSPRVSFAVVGVQKGGTSALFHFLSQHPRIDGARNKELHYFDDDTHRWDRPNYRAYHRHFRISPPWRRGLRGEATPVYLWWPNALERLAAYNPGIRLIAIFRDPVLRAHSDWRMARARGHEPLDFSTAIRSGRDRLVERSASIEALRRFSYVERGLYGAQTMRLLALFPRSQVLMLRQEDLAEDHDGTLRSIFHFLGLEDHCVPPERVFVGQQDAPLADGDAALLAGLYREDMALFERLSGLDTSAWLHRRL